MAQSVEYLTFFLMFVYFWGGGENEWGKGRERDTESEAGSMLPAVSIQPEAGLELRNGETMT